MITLFESLNPLLFDISWDYALYMISSVAQSCPTLCHPMDCSTPGFPVHHQLPELAQTHVHWVGDAIQPSHPLSSPSDPVFNLSQHQGLCQWVSYYICGFLTFLNKQYSLAGYFKLFRKRNLMIYSLWH